MAKLFRGGIVPSTRTLEKVRGGHSRTFRMADAGGRFSVISAAEVPPIRRGSALVRSGLPRNKFIPPSPRRIPRRKFLFRQILFLAASASEAIGSNRNHSDSGGLNRSPPRNCSANYITGSFSCSQMFLCYLVSTRQQEMESLL